MSVKETSCDTAIDMSLRDELNKVAQANKDHQYALKVYTERLEAELESVEKLLVHPAFPSKCFYFLIPCNSLLQNNQTMNLT